MSDTIPQPVPTDCRKYAKSLIEFNNLNTFNNVMKKPMWGLSRCIMANKDDYHVLIEYE
jgi:hypothetical protein